MSEVLSQSQIDALLAAARNGEMEADKPKETKPEKKYRKYDFFSPKKFTRDRLKMINSIFEGYARVMASFLGSLLHTACDVEVDSVEEQRYYEFSNALTERDVLTLVYDNLGDGDSQPVLFHLTSTVMLSMVDRMLGGNGDVSAELSETYKYTDIELQFYAMLTKQMVERLPSAWKNYLDIDFRFGRVEENPTMIQLIGMDETVVIAGITIRMPFNTGRLSICLPGTMLSAVFAKMNREAASARHHNEADSRDIMDYLRRSNLEVIAELSHVSLRLEDIYHLSVGDVISLDQPKDSKVMLNIGGRTWFDGQMGIYKKNLAVQIDNTYQPVGLVNPEEKGVNQ